MNLANRLLESRALTPEQLDLALQRQRQQRGFLADHLMDLGIITPEELRDLSPPRSSGASNPCGDRVLPENLLARVIP